MQDEAKSMFLSLFDFSFSTFITTKLIKVLYILAMVMIGLLILGLVGAAFTANPFFGVFTLLILAPLYALFGIVYARVILEIVLVLFKIQENTAEMAAQGRSISQTPSTPSTPPTP